MQYVALRAYCLVLKAAAVVTLFLTALYVYKLETTTAAAALPLNSFMQNVDQLNAISDLLVGSRVGLPTSGQIEAMFQGIATNAMIGQYTQYLLWFLGCVGLWVLADVILAIVENAENSRDMVRLLSSRTNPAAANYPYANRQKRPSPPPPPPSPIQQYMERQNKR